MYRPRRRLRQMCPPTPAGYTGDVTHAPRLGKRDAIVIGLFIAASAAAQTLAAIYFDSTGSLVALGGSAALFLGWVAVRFRG
jgi:hypothetical protein